MSVPPPYTPRVASSSEPREDCRDYLRTGRCKYGPSCKYNHPPNVQNGGGMRAPVDPNEPMFPIRPNEPVCQYYMKHGTCKFGQACKFHHPPQSSVTAALMGGGALVMNVGRKNDVPQLVMQGDGSTNGTPMMLQFLPQRPDEQDCIFFLKNGRCKYGATCRYHHPINFNQRRQDDGRRQRAQGPEEMVQHSNLQFINFPQGTSSSGGAPPPMVVSDGNLAYVAVDGSSGKGNYQPLSVVSNDGYCAPTGVPLSHNPDHASSTSSIASSYGTATSNLDHLGPHTEPDASGLWSRQKNNGSLASLNAYDTSNGRTQVAMGTRVTSDGSIASRRHRTASYGSASDGSVYMDANSNMNRSAASGSTLPASNSSSSMRGWRGERSASFDNTRRAMLGQYRPSRSDMSNSCSTHDGATDQGHNARASPGRRVQGRPRRSNEGVDAGLSMMTSALLTMLDTPEEAEGYDYYDEGMDHPSSQFELPPQRMPLSPGSGHDCDLRTEDVVRPLRDRNPQDHGYRLNGQSNNQDFFTARNSPILGSQYQQVHHQAIKDEDEGSDWLPKWQASKSVGRPMEENAQSISVMQPGHAAPNSSHSTSNVGLFLS